MGPVSLKVGHPDNLNGRWTFKGVYNDFPEYVGGTGTILVDGETQDRTDYYHIYYGPLRGGLCHGNDTGWQIRPIDETIFDIKLEIDEKKRIERKFLRDKNFQAREINEYIEARDDHYWLKGPSSEIYPDIESFLRSLGWNRRYDTSSGRIESIPIHSALFQCRDYRCSGPLPATTSNRAPSLLCDSSRINRSTNKEECITNRNFFSYSNIIWFLDNFYLKKC